MIDVNLDVNAGQAERKRASCMSLFFFGDQAAFSVSISSPRENLLPISLQ
jgi:hypothetical protein